MANDPLNVPPRQAEGAGGREFEPPTIGPVAVTRREPPMRGAPGRRMLLWVDGVGGFLVCLDAKVSVGQAVPGNAVDVALFADITRQHANLTRDAEGYLLEAVRPAQVNGSAVESALLAPGDRLTLGSSCQLQFQQPMPLSATARLDVLSRHRLARSVDAVLLMAETLVLGPGSQAHVCLAESRQPVILYQQKGGLGMRFAGPFSVDGAKCQDRGELRPTSRVAADGFTFALEPA